MKQLLFLLSCFFLSAQAAFSQGAERFSRHPDDQDVCLGVMANVFFYSEAVNENIVNGYWEYRENPNIEWSTLQTSNDWIKIHYFQVRKMGLRYNATPTQDLNGFQIRAVFEVTKKDGTGNERIYGHVATLRVNPPLRYITHPTPQQTCSGGEVTFSAEGKSACRPLTYEWWVIETGNPTGTSRQITQAGTSPKYSGFTTKSLTIENVTTAHHNQLYFCKLKVANPMAGDVTDSQQARLTVQGTLPPITHPSARDFCTSTVAAYEVTVGGSGATNYQWQWREDAAARWADIDGTRTPPPVYSGYTTRSLSVANLTLGDQGYQYRCRLSLPACGTIHSQAADMRVSSPPDLPRPASKNICPGSETVFEAPATRVFTYQWQQRANTAATWVTINEAGTSPRYSGQTTRSLKVENATSTHNNYQYRCQYTVDCGAIDSRPAVLTVNSSLPEITHPAPTSACAGGEAAFQVSAAGTDITGYQWQQRTGNAAEWVVISQAGSTPEYLDYTTRHLKVNDMTAAHNGYQYRCQLRSTLCSTINSNTAALTVTTSPITQPAGTSVCAGTAAAFAIAAGSNASAHQWQWRANATATWADISAAGTSPAYSGHITSALRVENTTIAHNGYQYRCRFTVPNCGRLSSNQAILTVNTPPDIPPPASKNICPEGETAFEVAYAGSDITISGYQWQQRAGNAADWVNISGSETAPTYKDHTTPSLKVANAASTHNNYQYRCRLTTSCGTFAGPAAILTVNQRPDITHPVDTNVCPDAEAAFQVSVAGSDVTGYQWQYRTPATAAWITISNALRSPAYHDFATGHLKVTNMRAAHNGYQYRCQLSSTLCTAIYSNTAALTIKTPPPITHPEEKRVCRGGETSFTVAGNGSNVTAYQWQQRTGETAVWANISAEGSSPKYSEYRTPQLNVKDIMRAHNGYQYRCVLTETTCGRINSNPAILTVNTPPEITDPVPKNICPGSETAFEITAGGEVTAYKWQRRINANAGWANISGTETAPTYKDPATRSLKVANATSAHNGYQYRCRLTAACGTFYSNWAILTVNPLPDITHPGAKSVCPGVETDFQVTARGADISAYQWQQHINDAWVDISEAGSPPVYGDYTTNRLKVKAKSAENSYEYRCRLTSTLCGMIYSNQAALTVTRPVVSPLANQNICAGNEAAFKVSATHEACISGYKWQQRNTATTEWVDISGTETSPKYSGHTTGELKIKEAAITHNGYQYRCRLLSGDAWQDIEAAGLFVNPPLEILSHPKDSTVSEKNARAAFRLEVKGIKLSYQWQVSHDQEKTWADIREVGSAPKYEDKSWETNKLQINEISLLANDYSYRCRLSATSCSGEAGERTSNAAKLKWDTSTGIADQSPAGEATLQVYPNPARHQLNVKLWHSAEGKTTLSLYNAVGQKVWSDQTIKNGEMLNKDISISHLPIGLYILKIEIGGDVLLQTKVVVGH